MKHKILFLAANPPGTSQRAHDEECKAIELELRLTAGRDAFEVVSRWSVSVDELMRHLNELSPTVMHFSGHANRDAAGSGAPDADAGPREVELQQAPGIMLWDRDRAQYVDQNALARMIMSASPTTRLVVLNACHSADVAASLSQFVDCVVGVDGALDDATARSLAVGFYRALGNRRSVGNAVQQAIATLHAMQLPGELVTCHSRDGVDPERMFVSDPSVAPAPRPPRPAAAARTTWQPLTSHPRAAAEPYDLFLAHPAPNKATAQALYDLLQPDVRVFLACRSLSPSEHWEEEIAAAQRAARATVLVLSPDVNAAWFLGDEVLAAMALHRASPDAYRLVAVLLGSGIALPRCLGDVEAIDAVTAGLLPGVAGRLRELVSAMHCGTAPWSAPPGPPRNRPARGDHFQLYARLSQIGEAMFEQLVTHIGVERDSLAPRTAALPERALDIALLAALDSALCRRVSAELDRRAPWTRR